MAWGLAMAGLRAAAAGEIVVDESHLTRSYGCAGGSAVITGDGNVLSFEGCSKLVVKGSDNQIGTGTTSLISILGSRNKLTFTEGSDGSRPQLVDMGKDNTVSPAGGKEGPDAEPDKGRVTIRPGPSAAAELRNVVVTESGRKATLDCSGGSASVDGNKNEITLRGCSAVAVQGSGNRIRAFDARTIILYGNANHVTWTGGTDGHAPVFTDLGQRNVVKPR